MHSKFGMEKVNGVSTLAPFSCKAAGGFSRRPKFLHKDTLTCIGTNAYEAVKRL